MKKILGALIGNVVTFGMTYLGFVLNIVFFKVTWFLYFGIIFVIGVFYFIALIYLVGNNQSLKNKAIKEYNWFTFSVGLITNSLIFYMVYQTNPIIASFYLLTIFGFMFLLKIHKKMLEKENQSNKEKEN